MTNVIEAARSYLQSFPRIDRPKSRLLIGIGASAYLAIQGAVSVAAAGALAATCMISVLRSSNFPGESGDLYTPPYRRILDSVHLAILRRFPPKDPIIEGAKRKCRAPKEFKRYLASKCRKLYRRFQSSPKEDSNIPNEPEFVYRFVQDANGSRKTLIPFFEKAGFNFFPRPKNQDENTFLALSLANADNSVAMDLLNSKNIRFSLIDKITYRVAPIHLIVAKGYDQVSSDSLLSVSNFELLRKIVELGADVNLKNFEGNTPLHIACARWDVEMIEFLLAHGADREALNSQNQKPADLLTIPYQEAGFILYKSIYRSDDRSDYEGRMQLIYRLDRLSPEQLADCQRALQSTTVS